jgi:hypothetical protein
MLDGREHCSLDFYGAIEDNDHPASPSGLERTDWRG